MKTLRIFVGSFALAALACGAQAQQAPAVTTKTVNPQGKTATARATADHRAAAYKGPKVVKDSKKLGNEMLHDSKPAPPQQVAPVKQ